MSEAPTRAGNGPGRATIRDVARRAGVSVATVTCVYMPSGFIPGGFTNFFDMGWLQYGYG